MLYLEDFLELIELLPSELRDRFTEMRELDLQVQNAMDRNDESVKMFFKNAAHLAPEERQRQVDKIRKHYYKIIDDADEKVCLANAMQDLVERFLRKLDSELGKFKGELEADNPGITEQLEKKVLEAEEAQNKSKREKRKRTARCVDSSNSKPDFDKPNGSNGPSGQKISTPSAQNAASGSNSSTADPEIVVDEKPNIGNGPSSTSSSSSPNFHPHHRHVSPPQNHHPFTSQGSWDRDPSGPKTSAQFASTVRSASPSHQDSAFGGSSSATMRNNNNFDIHGPSPNGCVGGLAGRGTSGSTRGISPRDEINSSIMADINAATASRRNNSNSNIPTGGRVAEYRTLSVGDGQQMTVIHQGIGGPPIPQLSPNSGLAGISPINQTSPSAFLHAFQHSSDARSGGRPRKLNSRVGEMLKEVAMRNEIRDSGTAMLGGNPSGMMGPMMHGASNSEDESSDPNEPRYCICNRVSYGEMVACDNKDCPFEWFHYSCVGITQPPKGKWYCPQCTAAMRRRASRLAPDQILGS